MLGEKGRALKKLMDLSNTALSQVKGIDKLLYSTKTLSKKEEEDLYEKLGKKVPINSMPSAARFRTELASFQRDLDKSMANKSYGKLAMLGGPTHLNFGSGGFHLNLGISHEHPQKKNVKLENSLKQTSGRDTKKHSLSASGKSLEMS